MKLKTLFLAALVVFTRAAAQDPLPSWNEGMTKQAILQYVQEVTDPNSPDFVKEEDRIATVDNDGTLWSSHPMYFQLFFALDRVKALPNDHPLKAVLEKDQNHLASLGEKGIAELLMATHAGMTTDEFEQIVTDWIATAKHPRFQRPFTDLVFQPMLELLSYLRDKGFKTYIVSGGGIEFMRPWTQKVYGIPPEQVVGSSIKTKYEIRDGKPVLIRLPEINFIDDKEGKPIGIHQFIGRRPILAIGNSDGDLAMLEWTASSPHKNFTALVHHTDADREYAYDRDTPFGRLDKGLDQGWTLIDMKKDWNTIYPFERK